MKQVNRRDLGKIAATLAAGTILPNLEAVAQPPAPSDRSFPANFIWGSATASYQVEGAVKEDGRGPTIWDTFSHTAGKTFHGETGDVATDSYHRYAEDIAVMKHLGLKACRFSIAWSRIFPTGTGQPNQKGIDHYRRFTEALLAAGIAPYATLYHWDLPQPLEDRGGWQNKDTAKAFGDYSGYTAGKLSDLIHNWMTMNEISSFIDIGYESGRHAPGLTLPRGKVAQARHHAVLGHGLAVRAIRASTPAGTRVGSAENANATIPAFNAPEHVAAARKAFVEENARYLTVMQTGRYTEHYLANLGADAPKFTPEEMSVIGSPTDFQGLNIYTATPVRAANNAMGYEVMPRPTSYPHMASPWLTIGPEALYWAPKFAAEVFKIKEIYITENGCSADDVVQPDGQILDTDRVMYLSAYLTQLQRGIHDGNPVRGYFLWSLLDNYEWADGYSKRFGITYVDFQTQKRTPKLSAAFYRNLIQTRSL
jgi:beta-glucosidase